MILTDREIQIALEQGSITIDPEPADKAYSSTSVDLTLDPTLTVFRDGPSGIEQIVDPTHENFDHDLVLEQLTQQTPIGDEGYVFRPNKLILAWTKEYIKLDAKSKFAARVEGKSSLARLGIAVHITAPTIHAGFDGQIRLEMIKSWTPARKTSHRDAYMPAYFRTDIRYASQRLQGQIFRSDRYAPWMITAPYDVIRG